MVIPMSERKYRLIPMDLIRVLNSRNRDETQFQDNVRNIDVVGLLKSILVNEKYFSKEGYYQLVCGEGRYTAYKLLKRSEIPAEVISCSKKTALLLSLVENIARVSPNTMWFARELKRMKDSGMSIERISQIAGKSESYIFEYIRLVELGEERLIRGVDSGLFPISFATDVAKSSSETIQNVLMDAFDSGLINSGSSPKIRNLIEGRVNHGRYSQLPQSERDVAAYSLKTLRDDISKSTEQKEGYVREATEKENRLFVLLDGLNALWADAGFASILKEEGLSERPRLLGKYSAGNVESGSEA